MIKVNNFEVGDEVKHVLPQTPSKMIVVKIHNEGRQINCRWWNGEKFMNQSFVKEELCQIKKK